MKYLIQYYRQFKKHVVLLHLKRQKYKYMRFNGIIIVTLVKNVFKNVYMIIYFIPN